MSGGLINFSRGGLHCRQVIKGLSPHKNDRSIVHLLNLALAWNLFGLS